MFFPPGAPLAYVNDGGGGGGGPSNFFRSEILAKSDFWSIKDAGIFLSCNKKKQMYFFRLRIKD